MQKKAKQKKHKNTKDSIFIIRKKLIMNLLNASTVCR